MRPIVGVLVAALLLVGCANQVTFDRAQFAFLMGDVKEIYNANARLAGQACRAGVANPDDCKAAVESGKVLTALYADTRKHVIEDKSVDPEKVLNFLEKLAEFAKKIGLPALVGLLNNGGGGIRLQIDPSMDVPPLIP